MNKKVNLAVVGATGLVGTTFLKVLEERDFPIQNLYLMASKKSAGSTVQFKQRDYIVEELNDFSFDKPIDIALFSAGGSTSEKFAPIAAAHGCVVVDNSSAWRMDPDVPLIVPEVNPKDIQKMRKGIIANPNCSTIQAMLPLKALHDAYQIKRIVYSTYQSVSGAGIKGLNDLEEGQKGNDICVAFPHPIAGNCIPHIDKFMANGYTKEELKMVNETHKILGDSSIRITATTVRVPVRGSHSESINVEFNKPFDLEESIELLKKMPGLIVQDDVQNNIYPLARQTEGHDEVYVGRIRRDFSVDSGMNLWCVADNIRKGAATNAVQIAELLIK
ncbi:MAG: aspartate-semialdehyde dehydrogenase [Clostridia bacterium]|nr:aspartate-semialdehyde dehydrogenase [Clostridia bacterium]